MWVMKWQTTDRQLPKYAVHALKECNKHLFPNIYVFLTLLATLQVTSTTVERTFSTLRRLKTCLLNRTGDQRLTGLALMAVHRDTPVDVEAVIYDYAKKANRRSHFIH